MHAKPIVIGFSMENFPQIADEFVIRGGLRQIEAGEEDPSLQVLQLTEAFVALLQDPAARQAAGRAAYSVLEANRGATGRTAEVIAAIFEEVGARPWR